MRGCIKDFVSFGTAKLLKDRGFDGLTESYYYDDDSSRLCFGLNSNYNCGRGSYVNRIAAPTLQDAMAWLREKEGVSVDVETTADSEDCDYEFGPTPRDFFTYEWKLTWINGSVVSLGDTYGTWEEAVEDGIRYAAETIMESDGSKSEA